MNLEAYLAQIETCPDDRLKQEWGVYDNFAIHLDTDFDTLVSLLKNLNDYEHIDTNFEEREENQQTFFNYIPGTVEVQIYPQVNKFFITGHNIKVNGDFQEGDKDLEKHYNKQNGRYQTTITLHWNQSKIIEGASTLRAIAMVIKDISQMAMEQKIPLCMTKSIGWDYLNTPEGFERIVYFPE